MKIYKDIEIYVDGCKNTCEVGFHIDADDCRLAIADNHQEGEAAVLRGFSDFISFFNSVPEEIYTGFTDKHREILSEHLEKVLTKIKGADVV
jgi:hypothetical protein